MNGIVVEECEHCSRLRLYSQDLQSVRVRRRDIFRRSVEKRVAGYRIYIIVTVEIGLKVDVDQIEIFVILQYLRRH